MNEIDTLRRLKHPNIISLHEVYEEKDYIHLVFELMRGGELQSKVRSKRRFQEKEAARIMRKLLETVAFCHENGIIHRDIKPGNIILRYTYRMYMNEHSKESNADIKLIDFGLAIDESQCTKENPLCGSPGYMAPEVFSETIFDEKTDIYSCGVVLYVMLCGELPFDGASAKEVIRQNKKNSIKFLGHEWIGVSKEAKEFILELTHTNPDTRPTAFEALESVWFEKVLKDEMVNDTPSLEGQKSSTDPYCSALARSFASGLPGSILNESSEIKQEPLKMARSGKSASQLRKISSEPEALSKLGGYTNVGTSDSIIVTAQGENKGSLQEETALLKDRRFPLRQHAVSGKVGLKPLRKSFFAPPEIQET